MADDGLPAPVARLLELGEPKYSRDFEWPDYRAYGLGTEHFSALISLAINKNLLNHPDESDPRGWAPIHAWRALGQLRATEAIHPLIQLFHELQDNDWMIEEMPDVFALIGPPAFTQLSTYLQDVTRPAYSRLVAATSLMQIGLAWPGVRDLVVAVLAEQLEKFRTNIPGVNGVLIANLVELQAIEKTDLIHRVFSVGQVDRFIVGDWRDVQVRLGLRNPALVRSDQAGLVTNIKKVPPDPQIKPGDSLRPAIHEPRTQPRASAEPRTQPRRTTSA